mgnify:FL=1
MADENMTENATFNLGNSANSQPNDIDAYPQSDLNPYTQSIAPSKQAVTKSPAGYEPGYTSPVRRQYEDSTMFKIGAALASWGEDMPVQMKLRIAQDQADLAQSKDRLAWANYHQTNKLARISAQEHNQNMMFKMFEIAPSIKGHLSSLSPEERPKAAEWYSKYADSVSPGFGKVWTTFGKAPHIVLGMDKLMKSPGDTGKAFRQLVETRGYENVIADPILHELIDTQSRDLFPLVHSRFTKDEKDALIKGEMPETQFRAAFMKASQDESFQNDPQDLAYAQHVLNAPWAQGMMAHYGVKLDATALKMQSKEKPAGEETISGIKAKEYNKLKNRVMLAEQDPDAFAPAQVADMKKQMGILLGTESKDQGSNPNNMVNQRLQIISKGKVSDVESIATMKPAEQAQAYAWAEQARKEQDQASGMGSLNAKMSTPGDTSQYVRADELLKNGRIIPVRDNVTEGELRTNKAYLKTTPEQRKEIRELNVIAESARQIFKSAGEAFDPPHSTMGMAAAELAINAEENALTIGPKVAAKAAYPKLADYIARREATLGKFARAISGEVGVLTDQDAGRVRNIFPNATDSASTRKAKERSFKALFELNKRFAAEVLAGEMSPDEAALLKETPKYRDAAQGILGSAEGVGKSQEAPGVRGESLLEQMRKGK